MDLKTLKEYKKEKEFIFVEGTFGDTTTKKLLAILQPTAECVSIYDNENKLLHIMDDPWKTKFSEGISIDIAIRHSTVIECLRRVLHTEHFNEQLTNEEFASCSQSLNNIERILKEKCRQE